MESRLNDSNLALKELREDLDCSRRDNGDKSELIQNITAQRDELRENLDEALHQVMNYTPLFMVNKTSECHYSI